jgi:putative CocE/NonD family hydrolase
LLRWLSALGLAVTGCDRSHTAAEPPRLAGAPPPPASVAEPRFDMLRVMIPMRDGVSLETVIFTPQALPNAAPQAPSPSPKPLPMLLARTPYGIPSDDRSVRSEWYAPLRADGYIFVFQNLRGRFGSEGVFVMDRPPRAEHTPASIDETTDAFDTIEWLVHNVPQNSGRVGMLGGSYSAWTATMALLEPHPALAVVSEAASPADQFVGDDYHHNGAFRLSYCFEYSAWLESVPGQNTPFVFDRLDTYEWYLGLGPLSQVNQRYFHGRVPSWNMFVEHPNQDDFWLRRSFASHLRHATVPTLNVAGFWDQEDYYGPLKIYELLERTDTARTNHLVIGPWNHDGWSGPGRRLADIDFGSDTGVYYRKQIQARWLARWLHDEAGPAPAEARIFVTGKNEWQDFERWPPTEHIVPTRLYLHPSGKLRFEPPRETGSEAFDEYVSDPEHPVPYVRRPIRPFGTAGSEWSIWQALDQRFVDHRPDVLSWETDVLERDVTVLGNVRAELFASSSGSDSDWIVKLIDVHAEGSPAPSGAPAATPEVAPDAPDLRGYQLMIAGEVVRARFRSSLAHPEPLVPGEVVRYEVPLHSRAHVFAKGHKIMVQVQSTWFPLVDRNPQRFVPSIFAARASDYVTATQRIVRAREAPSAIVLPVLAP